MALDNIFVLKKKEIIMIKPFFGVLYFLKIISSYKTLLTSLELCIQVISLLVVSTPSFTEVNKLV